MPGRKPRAAVRPRADRALHARLTRAAPVHSTTTSSLCTRALALLHARTGRRPLLSPRGVASSHVTGDQKGLLPRGKEMAPGHQPWARIQISTSSKRPKPMTSTLGTRSNAPLCLRCSPTGWSFWGTTAAAGAAASSSTAISAAATSAAAKPVEWSSRQHLSSGVVRARLRRD